MELFLLTCKEVLFDIKLVCDILFHSLAKAPSWGLTKGRTLQRGFINIDSEHDLETVFSYSLDYLSVSCRSFKE